MGKFDHFREVFPSLSFNDLKKQHEEWYREYPGQTRVSKQFFINCFKYVVKTLKRSNLNVVELGGYEGELALQILKFYPEMQWLNIEIISHRMKKGLENYQYKEHVLSDQLWNENLDLRKYDVFVSSHTLEHLSDVQVERLFHYLGANNLKYLILQVPIKVNGQTWQGYGGAHVLRMGSTQMKKLLNPLYCLVYERGAWHSIWGRR